MSDRDIALSAIECCIPREECNRIICPQSDRDTAINRWVSDKIEIFYFVKFRRSMMRTTKLISTVWIKQIGLTWPLGCVRRTVTVKNLKLTHHALTICLMLFSLSILCTPVAYAESPELFLPLPPQEVRDVKPDQAKHIDRINKRPTTVSVTLVRLDINALRGDSTQMSLPDAKMLNFNKTNVETRSTTDFTWFGALSGVPGKATLVVRDGNITGSVRDNGNLYRVEPVGNGVHAVIKVDVSRFPPEHPPSFKEKEKRGGAAPRSAVDTPKSDGPVGLDVLVAYTPAARTAVADIAATIQLAIAEANQSYQNSKINIRLNLVDSFEVSYSETGKSFDTILADFIGMADVNSRRNSSCADMAVMIINKSDYCGLADAIMANASNAFAVVHYDCATGYYSFAHELGHLQGARHDPANDPTTTPFSYGHGFQHTSPPPSWRTIMAYNCPGGCPRIQYWSNPNVNYNNLAMGTAATNDNARVLNETAGTVAGFKTCPPKAPDLVVESLTHSPANPTTQTQMTFTAVVKNTGTGQAGPSTLSFRVGGETPPGRTFAIPSLAPNQNFTVSRQETMTVAQNYRNTATADINSNVVETNETNNQRTDDYTVLAPPVCVNGAKRTVRCQVAGRTGTRTDVCVAGIWRLGPCADRCLGRPERFVRCRLAKGRSGYQRQVCRNGVWVKSGPCLPNIP